MQKSVIIQNNSNNYCEIDLILYKICFHGAPTINRVKPASLICFKNNQAIQLKDMWGQYKDEVKDIISCSFKEVSRCDEGVNVLFYWDEWLERIIRTKRIGEYLVNVGYKGVSCVDDALDILTEHFKKGCPHEIGIFLGYPLSDVIAFSSNEKQQCLGVGYWKVFSNMQRAKNAFDLYDKAKLCIINSLESGIKPKKLLEAYS